MCRCDSLSLHTPPSERGRFGFFHTTNSSEKEKVHKAGLQWSLAHTWWIFKFLLAIKLNPSSLQFTLCPLHLSVQSLESYQSARSASSCSAGSWEGKIIFGIQMKKYMAMPLPEITSVISTLFRRRSNESEDDSTRKTCCLRRRGARCGFITPVYLPSTTCSHSSAI